MNMNATRGTLALLAFLLSIALVPCLDRFIVLFAKQTGWDVSSLGQAGDMFGVANFAVGALALMGVFLTYGRQTEEIRRMEGEHRNARLFQLLNAMQNIEDSALVIQNGNGSENLFTAIATEADHHIAQASNESDALNVSTSFRRINRQYLPAIVRWASLLELFLSEAEADVALENGERVDFGWKLLKSYVHHSHIKTILLILASDEVDDHIFDSLSDLGAFTGVYNHREAFHPNFKWLVERDLYPE